MLWYIYLHFVDFCGKCWQIYHTWILWVFERARHIMPMQNSSVGVLAFEKRQFSKNFPTDPWSIPQTPNQQFMLWNSCNIWGFGDVWGVGFPLEISYRYHIVQSHDPTPRGSVSTWSIIPVRLGSVLHGPW